MREDRQKQDARRKRAEEKALKRAEAEAGMGAGMATMAAVDEQADVEKEMRVDLEKAGSAEH